MTILTVSGPDGQPLGMTASSLASVSLQPPLISVCIDHQAEMHDTISRRRDFVVNVLASAQEALSRRFADQHDDRFDGVGYHSESRRADPAGRGARLHRVRAVRTYPGGDHTIVIGRVIGGGTGEGRPLLYYRGGYAALG